MEKKKGLKELFAEDIQKAKQRDNEYQELKTQEQLIREELEAEKIANMEADIKAQTKVIKLPVGRRRSRKSDLDDILDLGEELVDYDEMHKPKEIIKSVFLKSNTSIFYQLMAYIGGIVLAFPFAGIIWLLTDFTAGSIAFVLFSVLGYVGLNDNTSLEKTSKYLGEKNINYIFLKYRFVLAIFSIIIYSPLYLILFEIFKL